MNRNYSTTYEKMRTDGIENGDDEIADHSPTNLFNFRA